MNGRLRLVTLFAVFCGSICFVVGDSLRAEAPVDYVTQIKPLLAAKCYACHGAIKQEAGLRLDTRSLMLRGGDGDEILIPGDASASLLIERISADDERMPPAEDGAALKAAEIAKIRAWIDQGAPAPEEQVPRGPRDHWAFRSIAKPTVPSLFSSGMANPIDTFLESQRVARGLSAQSTAERSLLIRRLYLDLIGLPPTLAQQRDQRPWEEIVDELLCSPHHGERWARHWMDIWRYSDWYGLGEQLRYSQKHIWRWRDWIIESLNQDKGYDRMIVEMLAGDELAPTDPDVLRATGFLARNYYLFNRTTWLDSTIEHTGKAFLGLTLNCAKCHDHKYDPITHVDYYNFRAIFEPHQVRLDPIPGVTDFEHDGLPRVFDDHLEIDTFLHLRGDPKNPDPDTSITAGVPAILASFATPAEPVILPAYAYAPGTREYVQQDRLHAAAAKVTQAREQLAEASERIDQPAVELAAAKLKAEQAAQAALSAIIAADTAKFRGGRDDAAREDGPADTDLLHLPQIAAQREAESAVAKAEYQLLAATAEKQVKAAEEKLADGQRKLDAVAAGKVQYTSIRGAKKALESPAHQESDYPVTYPPTSTGRRLALARWITSPENPLTARVAVNHVWARHFGQPLVESMFDFGLRTSRPVHAELLDYLAAEFMESGWSFRHLHRLIVTSRAYRLTSSSAAADEVTLTGDPTNVFYWRMHPRRMESQVIRDSLLKLAGELDPRLGGPSLDVGAKSRRRSLYFKHSRDQQDRFLAMFDDADHLQCYRRSESIVPQQALALANSELSLEMADRIAMKLVVGEATMSRDRFIEVAFETLLGRRPEGAERIECQRFCDDVGRLLEAKQADPEPRIRTRLVHALLNHNDFVSIR